MRTKDILSMVYGQEADGFHTRLADIADSLVSSHEDRETRRMLEAEVRDQLAGYGPLLSQMQHALTAEQNQALTDSRLPAVMTFDAYCLMKDASKADPNDRGLKQAAHLLYDRWNQDPTGHLTVGELVSFRDHFVDMFPKSAAKQVFDENIPNAGFQTLTNLPHLTRIAAEITDQASYERAMELHGLDGDRPEQIRARAYIKGIAEFALSDEPFVPMETPSAKGAFERAVNRVAQEFFDEDEAEAEEAIYAPSEQQLPHDENSEEMASINSPVTGEPLVIELGIKDEQGIDGMDPGVPGEDEENSFGVSPLPSNFADARVAQQLPLDLGQEMPASSDAFKQLPTKLQRLMVLARGKLVRSGKGSFVFEFRDEDTAEMFAEQARGQASGNRVIVKSAQVDETVTMMTDPTSGEELQVSLRHITDERPEMDSFEGEDENMVDEVEQLNDNEMMSQEMMDQEGSTHTADSAIYRKTLPQTEHTDSDKHTHNIQPEYWQSQRGKSYMRDYIPTQREQEEDTYAESRARKQRIKNMDKAKSKTKSAEKGFDEAMNVQVSEQPGSMQGKYSDTDLVSKKKKKPKKAQKLTVEQVHKICASMGLDAQAIEKQLLDGNEIAVGTYALRIGNQDDIELRHLAQVNTVEGARVMRTASLAEFDGIVADFMALTAAQFMAEPEEAPTPRQAAKRDVEKVSSYVLNSDVPQGAPINARRMMASIWKIIPDAEGELLDNGRLSVILRTAAQRDVNRIQRVLSDVFGVRHIEAQVVAQTPQAKVQQTNADSPYLDQTPVNKQPAGAPMQPMQAPQQLPQTGSSAQQDFIARHTDPNKKAVHNAQMDLEANADNLTELLQAVIDLGVPQELAQDTIDAASDELMHRLRVKGLDDTAEEVRWRALHREAQLDEAENPDEDELLDEVNEVDLAEEDTLADLPLDDASVLDDDVDPVDDPTGLPDPSNPDPSNQFNMNMNMPADSSQMTVDMSQGQLQFEDEEAVRASAMHFRNLGMMPLEALDEFSGAFNGLLDKYGDTANPQRLLAEAAIVRIIMEAFAQPAVVPVKAANKRAEMPHPKSTTQHPSKVKISKNWPQGEVPSPKTPKTQSGSPDGTFSDKKMQGKPSSHSWGGNKKPGGPQKGSRQRQPGASYPATNVGDETGNSGESAFDSKMNTLSKSAPGTVQSTSKSKKADLCIHFDPELGDFHLLRDEKRIAIHASLNEALADAERRRLGTEARILIDDGQGGFDEV